MSLFYILVSDSINRTVQFNPPLSLLLHTTNSPLQMDSLADLWVRSRKNPELLYPGSTASITQELEAWVIRRKANNDANMNISWDIFRVQDSIRRLPTNPDGLSEGTLATSMVQASALTATGIANLNRKRVSHSPMICSLNR